MGKNYYAILDAQLERLYIEQLNRGKPPEDILLQAVNDNNFKKLLNTTQTEIDEMNEKLKEDGYIRFPHPVMTPTFHLITFKGYIFIQDDKYTALNKRQKTKYTTQRLINFSLIFGGVAAGVYYLHQLALALC